MKKVIAVLVSEKNRKRQKSRGLKTFWFYLQKKFSLFFPCLELAKVYFGLKKYFLEIFSIFIPQLIVENGGKFSAAGGQLAENGGQLAENGG